MQGTTVARPLADVRFRWLLAGRTADQVGNAIQPLALGFAMLAVYGDATSLGVVVGANALGQVLLLLAGGVVADRLPRSVVLVASNVVAAVAQAGIVAMVLAELPALPVYALLAFVTGAAAAFDGPATVALVPEIVPSPSLTRANGNLTTARRIATIGGAPLAGLLVALVGPGWALGVDALSFLVAALCFSRLRGLPRPSREHVRTPLQDVADGWREFTSRTWVWAIVASFSVFNAAVTGGFYVAGVVIAERTVGAEGWGLVLGAFGVGSLVSSLGAARLSLQRPLFAGMAVASLGCVPLFALATEQGLAVLILTTGLAGASVTLFDVGWGAALQQHIPGDKLARVASIDSLGSFVAIPIGAFLAGPLGDAVGETTVAGGAGVLIVAASLLALLSREVRDLRVLDSAAEDRVAAA